MFERRGGGRGEELWRDGIVNYYVGVKNKHIDTRGIVYLITEYNYSSHQMAPVAQKHASKSTSQGANQLHQRRFMGAIASQKRSKRHGNSYQFLYPDNPHQRNRREQVGQIHTHA